MIKPQPSQGQLKENKQLLNEVKRERSLQSFEGKEELRLSEERIFSRFQIPSIN